MDKKAVKIILAVVMGVSFVLLLMSAWTLFSNFTVGKGAMDITTESSDSIAKAGTVAYWYSGAGFFILLPFIVGLICTCFAARRRVCLITAIYGLAALTVFIVLMALANASSYNEGEIVDEAYLLISAMQVNFMQAVIPMALLTAGAFAAIKCKRNKTVENKKAAEENERKENEYKEERV